MKVLRIFVTIICLALVPALASCTMPDAVSPEPAIDAAGIQIEDVWIRPPASVGGNGALYMTLTNRDDTPDWLLTVETSI